MEEAQLPPQVNPSNFPAKLWRLVNSSQFRSVSWDSQGETVLVNQALFECELLGAGPSRTVAPPEGLPEGSRFFKTKNFGSFVRQLNLYGFHKVVPGPAGHGNGSSAGPVHRFRSPHFRRGRPDLLARMKRLTSANRAKIAAGLEVSSRPANRSLRLLSASRLGDPPPRQLGEAASPGQFHQNTFCPYPCVSTSCEQNGALPGTSLMQMPDPCRIWQSSLVLPPGFKASQAFPYKRVTFPTLQSSTEVTYTVLPIPSPLHPHQESQDVAACLPNYRPAPSAHYSQAFNTTAPLQYFSPSAQLTDSAGLTAATYAHCSSSQEPPKEASKAAEFLTSGWLHNTSNETEKPKTDLEDVFQMADEFLAPAKAEAVRVEPVEIECSTLEPARDEPLLVTGKNSVTPSTTEESPLGFLATLTSDTSFVTAADQALTDFLLLSTDTLRATYTPASAESTAAEMPQGSVTIREAHGDLTEQAAQYLTPSSVMFAQEGPFISEQEPPLDAFNVEDFVPSDWLCGIASETEIPDINFEALCQMPDEIDQAPPAEEEVTSVKYESTMSETETTQFTLEAEPVKKFREETESSGKSERRKRRHSSLNDGFPGLHVLEGPAPKWGHFMN